MAISVLSILTISTSRSVMKREADRGRHFQTAAPQRCHQASGSFSRGARPRTPVAAGGNARAGPRAISWPAPGRPSSGASTGGGADAPGTSTVAGPRGRGSTAGARGAGELVRGRGAVGGAGAAGASASMSSVAVGRLLCLHRRLSRLHFPSPKPVS